MLTPPRLVALLASLVLSACGEAPVEPSDPLPSASTTDYNPALIEALRAIQQQRDNEGK